MEFETSSGLHIMEASADSVILEVEDGTVLDFARRPWLNPEADIIEVERGPVDDGQLRRMTGYKRAGGVTTDGHGTPRTRPVAVPPTIDDENRYMRMAELETQCEGCLQEQLGQDLTVRTTARPSALEVARREGAYHVVLRYPDTEDISTFDIPEADRDEFDAYLLGTLRDVRVLPRRLPSDRELQSYGVVVDLGVVGVPGPQERADDKGGDGVDELEARLRAGGRL